ncbi:MAG: sulfite exporter TauE/SafE family protein [Planctomycetota bacterium]|nr:sulfite exporter TauE/SafE family protein [Planctomycetota bacterium]
MDFLLASWFWFAVGVTFFASFVQGLTGFGMALVAVPLLLSHERIGTYAIPCLTIACFATVGEVLWRYRRHLDLRRTAWLGAPLLLTTPLGVLALRDWPLWRIQLAVGAILFAIGAWQLNPWARRDSQAPTGDHEPPAEAEDRPAPLAGDFSRPASLVVGGLSGILGGAVGMVGPLLAGYLIASGIERGRFKVTLNAVFLISLLVRTGNYAWQGLLPPAWALTGICLLPFAWLGSRAGLYMDGYIPAKAFARLVNVFLLGLGIWMASAALRAA